MFGGNDDTPMGWFQCGCKPNSYEFSADEILADMQHPKIVYHKDTLNALYTEVKDGVLIDKCGTYSINVNDTVVDIGKFSI